MGKQSSMKAIKSATLKISAVGLLCFSALTGCSQDGQNGLQSSPALPSLRSETYHLADGEKDTRLSWSITRNGGTLRVLVQTQRVGQDACQTAAFQLPLQSPNEAKFGGTEFKTESSYVSVTDDRIVSRSRFNGKSVPSSGPEALNVVPTHWMKTSCAIAAANAFEVDATALTDAFAYAWTRPAFLPIPQGFDPLGRPQLDDVSYGTGSVVVELPRTTTQSGRIVMDRASRTMIGFQLLLTELSLAPPPPLPVVVPLFVSDFPTMVVSPSIVTPTDAEMNALRARRTVAQ